MALAASRLRQIALTNFGFRVECTASTFDRTATVVGLNAARRGAIARCGTVGVFIRGFSQIYADFLGGRPGRIFRQTLKPQ